MALGTAAAGALVGVGVHGIVKIVLQNPEILSTPKNLLIVGAAGLTHLVMGVVVDTGPNRTRLCHAFAASAVGAITAVVSWLMG